MIDSHPRTSTLPDAAAALFAADAVARDSVFCDGIRVTAHNAAKLATSPKSTCLADAETRTPAEFRIATAAITITAKVAHTMRAAAAL